MKKILFVLVVCLISSLSLIFSTSTKAQIDAPDTGQPQCYLLTSAGITRVTCTGNFIDLYYPDGPPGGRCTRGSCLRDNTCYFVGFGTDSGPKNGPKCTNWRNQAEDVRGSDEDPGISTPDNSDPLASEDIFGSTRAELRDCRGADCVNNNPITKMVIYAINILGALVGVIAVVMIVIAGIQYSSSGGNPQVTAEAKKRIINVVIALATYFFLWAFLQWIIPGGALN